MTHRFIIGLLALLLFSAAQAETFSYRHLDIVKSSAEYDFGEGTTLDADFFEIACSLPINKTFFATGDYAEGDIENTIDLEGWVIGLGAHFPLNKTTDFTIVLDHSELEARNGSQSATSDGESLELGFRTNLNQQLELFAYYWADLDDSDDSVEIGGLVKLSSTVAIGLSYDKGDDYDATSIGLRVYFD